MTIKKRFLVSYIGGILIACFSMVAIIGVLFYVTTGTIATPSSLYRGLTQQRSLSQEEEEAYVILKNIAKMEPNKFIQNNPNLDEVLQQFEEKSLGIAIRKEKEILYYTKSLVENSLIVHFPAFDKDNLETRGTIDNAGRMYRYVKFDFYYDNDIPGSILVLKKESNFFEFMTKWGSVIIIGLLIITGLGLFFLNYLQRKTIIIPLENLGKGMEKIREGQLETTIVMANEKSALEVKQLVKAFEQMQKALIESTNEQKKLECNRKELIANISHDLKTPITSILGYVEGLQDGVADTVEKQNKYLATIHSKALALDYLIEELFLYSKLDADALTYKFEKINIKDFLDHIVEEFQLRETGVHFKLTYKVHSECDTLADRIHLNRAFSNLIENSINYRQEKIPLKIEITVSKTNKMLLVQFADNGKGISEEELPYVFDRFYRIDKSRNATIGGSGLGLAIVQQIIQHHKGKICITSKPAVGTVVTISLRKFEERDSNE